jgi:hypothetical protein
VLGPTLRRVLGALLLGVAALAALGTARMIRDGKAQLDTGARLADARDVYGAAAAFEDAARCYAPGSPYPGRALGRLSIMAKGAQMRGETELAAYLWEVVRRSIVSTRHLWQPNEELLGRAERELVALRSAATKAERSEASPEAAGRAPERPRDPSPLASVLLFAGLLSWIVGAIWLCVAPREVPSSRARRAAWLCAIGGFVLWASMSWFAG